VPHRSRRVMPIVIACNVLLAFIKTTVGFLGASWALVADGIESTADIFGSAVVWSGLRYSVRPADQHHPYGHGKAETVAGAVVSLLLLGAAVFIAIQSVQEIATPHQVPASFTLWVLAGVILLKEVLYQWLHRLGRRWRSSSLVAEAWHHRGDALTSGAAFIGISIALWGGPDYAEADDWAALLACGIIFVNGFRLLRQSMDELMDASADPDLVAEIRRLAGGEGGVTRIEKCRVRKAGLGLLLDIHVQVPGDLSVREGHRIGHAVQDRLVDSELPIVDVVVHLEPD